MPAQRARRHEVNYLQTSLCTAASLVAADLVVGYMGVPYQGGDMTSHLQYLTVRNERGREMLEAGGCMNAICVCCSGGLGADGVLDAGGRMHDTRTRCA